MTKYDLAVPVETVPIERERPRLTRKVHVRRVSADWVEIDGRLLLKVFVTNTLRTKRGFFYCQQHEAEKAVHNKWLIVEDTHIEWGKPWQENPKPGSN